jgi:hypothetical protein
MTAAGFNKIAIAGMLGNAVQESSMNPNAPGGGLWQQVTNFGGGTGGSLLHQMQVMLPQIQGLKAAMNAAGSPGAAAVIFEQGFEKAGIIAMQNRINAANQAFAQGYARGGKVGTEAWRRMHAESSPPDPGSHGLGGFVFASGGLVKMYDDVAAGLGNIPRNPGAVASYVDNQGGYSKALGMFKGVPVISISISPGNNVAADIYDMESGGKTAQETAAAIIAGRARVTTATTTSPRTTPVRPSMPS